MQHLSGKNSGPTSSGWFNSFPADFLRVLHSRLRTISLAFLLAIVPGAFHPVLQSRSLIYNSISGLFAHALKEAP